jgi:hypothetical protein
MADKTDTKDERKDERKPDHPQADSEVKAAAKKKGSAKPSGDGEYDGEVKDGYQWSKRDRAWIEWIGVDHSEDNSALPYGHEHVGDGSPQNPHRVQQKQRW